MQGDAPFGGVLTSRQSPRLSASLNKLPFLPEEHGTVARGRGIRHHCEQLPQWKPSHVLGQTAQPPMLSTGAWRGVSGPYGRAGPGHSPHAEFLQTWCRGVHSSRRAWARCRTGSSVCGKAVWASLLTFLPCLLPGCSGLARAAFFSSGRGAGVLPCQRILIKAGGPHVQRRERSNQSRLVETIESSPAASS